VASDIEGPILRDGFYSYARCTSQSDYPVRILGKKLHSDRVTVLEHAMGNEAYRQYRLQARTFKHRRRLKALVSPCYLSRFQRTCISSPSSWVQIAERPERTGVNTEIRRCRNNTAPLIVALRLFNSATSCSYLGLLKTSFVRIYQSSILLQRRLPSSYPQHELGQNNRWGAHAIEPADLPASSCLLVKLRNAKYITPSLFCEWKDCRCNYSFIWRFILDHFSGWKWISNSLLASHARQLRELKRKTFPGGIFRREQSRPT